MPSDAWITLATLGITVVVLVLDRYRPVLVLSGAVLVLLLADVIDDDIALSGLSSPAPATIAALYVVAGAATATGVLASLVDRLLERRGSLGALTASTAAVSAVVPNTPLIAMFAPRVVAWSRRSGASASRYLLPMSYASILGGVVTLIGTSTNLVVSDVLARSGEDPLGVFEITAVGLPVAVAGIVVLSTLGARLLPDRVAPGDEAHGGRRARRFETSMRIVPGGPLDGRTIEEAGLRRLDGVFLAVVERSAADGVVAMPAGPASVLRAGDVCCFVGDARRVVDLAAITGLAPVEADDVAELESAGIGLYEMVVAPASGLVGTTLRRAGFRARFGGVVLALHRSGRELDGQLGRVDLRAGDVMLVAADEDFGSRWNGHPDFSLVAHLGEPPPVRRGRAWLVTGVGALGLIAAATGVLSLLEAAAVAAAVVVVGGALSVREARRAVDLNVVLTMAASISLGGAVAESGLAAEIAGLVEEVDRLGFGDVGLVVGLMLVTLVLTELVTNTAAAAMMVPVGLSVAADVGAEPRLAAVAVLLGASCSFLSPIGYQTNLMVLSLGGYRFSDYPRVGAPLTLTTVVVAAGTIPLVFG